MVAGRRYKSIFKDSGFTVPQEKVWKKSFDKLLRINLQIQIVEQ